MSARLDAENAEAILAIVERDAFDKARQHFLGGWFGLGFHADTITEKAQPSR
jgi:predicted NAD/FAD-binding protein